MDNLRRAPFEVKGILAGFPRAPVLDRPGAEEYLWSPFKQASFQAGWRRNSPRPMARIPDETIERIQAATDIVDLVSEYVELRKRGRNFFGPCPFHTERTPSFSVNPQLQIYRCFGCGAGGNAFKFIQEIDNVSFVEAVSFLARRSGIALPQSGATADLGEFSDPVYRANELAQKYFHHMLLVDEGGRDALGYLLGRGIQDETIARFGLGYAPPRWDALLKVLNRRDFDSALAEKAGLALPRQSGQGHYDRFRDRITFPIANLSGRTIAFGARSLRSDQEPKYLNSPESPIYRKSRVLYGLNQTRGEIRRAGLVLVVEGYMDLLSLVQRGIPNVVASAGTALTPEQSQVLGRYAPEVVLVFDGDLAGSSAAQRAVEVLLGTGMDARVVSLPPEHDPDSFVREEGPDALLAAVEKAQSVLDFYLDQTARRSDLTTVQGKTRAIEAFKPLLARCRDAVRRDLMLREAAQRLGVDEPALRQEVQRLFRSRRPADRLSAAPSAGREDPPLWEKEFLGLLLAHPSYISRTAEILEPEAFVDVRSQRIVRVLFQEYQGAEALDLSLLMSRIEDEATVKLLSACAMLELSEAQVEEYWRDTMLRFQSGSLTRRIDQLKQSLTAAARSGDDAATEQLTSELDDLVKRRMDLEAPQGS